MQFSYIVIVKSPSHTLLYISISHRRRIPGQQIAETNLNYPHTAVISINFSVNMFLVVEHEIVELS